jgi:hypothetical protein
MGLGRGVKSLFLTALAAGAVALFAAGCGEEETSHVVEGEPLELGHLHVNVQLTRFLNPNDTEDSQYLEDQPPPPAGEAYLAVFLEMENEGDEELAAPTAEQIEIEDTTGEVFHPVESETVFALDFGALIPPDEALPADDTAAAEGPVQGSIVLFLIPNTAEQNRPLEMHLKATGEDGAEEEGTVELDL